MPLPDRWMPDGVDRLGVLHVIIDEQIHCQVGALEPEQGKCLFVVLQTPFGPRVSDDEARAVLDRLHNVRRFKELKRRFRMIAFEGIARAHGPWHGRGPADGASSVG